jgi:hypothetical protein
VKGTDGLRIKDLQGCSARFPCLSDLLQEGVEEEVSIIRPRRGFWMELNREDGQ